MSSQIETIQANHGHLHYLTPLFDAYRAFYEQPADLDGCQQFLSDRLSHDQSVVFLALVDGEAAGFTQLYPIFSSVSMKLLWLLNDLYVAEDFRKAGVARALMERARAMAEETGAKGLVLETAADNVPAQRLYEDLGWKKDEEFFHYFLNL